MSDALSDAHFTASFSVKNSAIAERANGVRLRQIQGLHPFLSGEGEVMKRCLQEKKMQQILLSRIQTKLSSLYENYEPKRLREEVNALWVEKIWEGKVKRYLWRAGGLPPRACVCAHACGHIPSIRAAPKPWSLDDRKQH